MTHRASLPFAGAHLAAVLGAPVGASVVAVEYNALTDRVVVVLEHESFPVNVPGAEPSPHELHGAVLVVDHDAEASDTEIGGKLRTLVEQLPGATVTVAALRSRDA